MSDLNSAVGEALLTHFRQLAVASSSLKPLQEAIVKLIAQRLPYCNWTGFYMLDPADPETLVIGPFVGAPTPHVRIPVNQGICGAAVASGKTVIVDDVSADLAISVAQSTQSLKSLSPSMQTARSLARSISTATLQRLSPIPIGSSSKR